MRRALLLTLVLSLILVPLASHANGIREERPTLVFGEIGGKAVLFSAGYERYFTNRFGLGAGGVAWGGSGGAVGLFPVYVAMHPFGDIHSMYLSTGVTYIAGVGNWSDEWVEWVGTVSVGYQYQSTGGFFVRPTMNMFYRENGFILIPGVALGGSF